MSKTRIKVSVTLPTAITADKIMLWGQNSSNTSSFAKVVTAGEENTFIVENGDYTFYAIAWTLTGLTGDVYCATSPNTLTGPDTTINLSTQNTHCSASHFKGSTTSTIPETFGSAKPVWCESVSNITAGTDVCTDDLENVWRKAGRGHAMSYRYVLKSYERTKNNYSFKPDVINSVCQVGTPDMAIALDGLAASFASTQVPVGDGSSTPFYFVLEVFPGDFWCDGSTHGKITITHKNGLKKDSSTTKYFIQGGSTHKLYVRMGEDEICNSTAEAQTFAGGMGARNSPHLICNPTQFYNMHTARTTSFKLMSDIDLTPYYYGVTTLPNIPNGLSCLEKGSNFLPLGYDGVCGDTGESFPSNDFDGGGKTITGLKMSMPSKSLVGLFMRKYGGEIRRLKMVNPNIKALSYSGALVGVNQATIRDVVLEKAQIEGVNSVVGGIAGGATAHPNDCLFKNIKADVVVRATLGTVGGIIAQGESCEFHNVGLTGYVSSITSGTVGGIAATLSNSILDNVSFEGFVMGHTDVGGITANLYETKFQNTKAVGAVMATSTGTALNVGGLVGFTNGSPGATSFMVNNYFFGHVIHYCSDTVTPTTCGASNVVGDTGGWGAGSLTSNYYNLQTAISGYSVIPAGTARAQSIFFDSTAAWPAAFSKLDGDLPRLGFETTALTSDLRHPCRTVPHANETVANQIIAGRGDSSDTPISVCRSQQVEHMQSVADHATKYYKVLAPVVMTSTLPPSTTDFSGQIDGNYYGLIRPRVYGAMGLDAAWWRSITSTGVIKNMYFLASVIEANGAAATTALIAKTNNGTLDRLNIVATKTFPESGENAIVVHTNAGTIKNSFAGGSGVIKKNMAGVVALNSGTIEDSIFNPYFVCTTGIECTDVSGVTNLNTATGIIRRVEISPYIEDVFDGNLSPSNFTFIANTNGGTIEDVHIKSNSRILSKAYAAHAITIENYATGVIRRIYNEGFIRVASGNLPSLVTPGDIDYMEGASSLVGWNWPGGTFQQYGYTKHARWTYPSQYGNGPRVPGTFKCTITVTGGLNPTWETAMVNVGLFGRFGMMTVENEAAPYLFASVPTITAGNDTIEFYDPAPCSLVAGNPVAYFRPLDQLNGDGELSTAQTLSWGTFSSWNGAMDITIDAAYHTQMYNFQIGASTSKPVWIFDTTRSLRMNR